MLYATGEYLYTAKYVPTYVRMYVGGTGEGIVPVECGTCMAAWYVVVGS